LGMLFGLGLAGEMISQPAVFYAQPTPVYVQSAPVYVRQVPVYVQSAPAYSQPAYQQPAALPRHITYELQLGIGFRTNMRSVGGRH
jgi:hypothetical protein